MILHAGRHITRRAYPGVSAKEWLLSLGLICLTGTTGFLAGVVIAEQSTSADGGWVATIGSTLPAVITSTSRAPPTATTVGAPPAPAQGPPGMAGPPGPPGPPGAPAPTVIAPATTAPPTTRPCRTPPSHPHATTPHPPCLPNH